MPFLFPSITVFKSAFIVYMVLVLVYGGKIKQALVDLKFLLAMACIYQQVFCASFKLFFSNFYGAHVF
jgi:hypothetical protein